jgi:hypothetical protein
MLVSANKHYKESMDNNLEKYYEGQFEMTGSQGWKDFLETVEALIQKDANILTVKDPEDLYKRQGRLDILHWVKNWRDACEMTFKQAQDEENL